MAERMAKRRNLEVDKRGPALSCDEHVQELVKHAGRCSVRLSGQAGPPARSPGSRRSKRPRR